MKTWRRELHAVVLGDGRVLVIGNSEDDERSEPSTTAELWDPTTGIWTPTESLNKRRSQFAAVALMDGRALVTGGLNETQQSFSSTYVYDPRSGDEDWSKVGLLGTARTRPSEVVLHDGRVLLVGGYFHVDPTGEGDRQSVVALAAFHSDPGDGTGKPRLDDVEAPPVGAALATVELFDPATGSWSGTGHLTYARYGAAAATLADGRVLVVGSASATDGATVDGRAYDSAEIYDPSTGRFSLAGRLPAIDRAALEKQGARGANPVPDGDPDVSSVGRLVALSNGGAVLIGHGGWWKHQGDITRSFRFDAQAGRWSEIGQTWIVIGEPSPVLLETPGVRNLAGSMVAALPDGRVLVAGGEGAFEYGDNENRASAELYDPTTDIWTALPPMPGGHVGGEAVALADGSVLLMGGNDGYDQEGSEIRAPSATRFVP